MKNMLDPRFQRLSMLIEKMARSQTKLKEFFEHFELDSQLALAVEGGTEALLLLLNGVTSQKITSQQAEDRCRQTLLSLETEIYFAFKQGKDDRYEILKHCDYYFCEFEKLYRFFFTHSRISAEYCEAIRDQWYRSRVAEASTREAITAGIELTEHRLIKFGGSDTARSEFTAILRYYRQALDALDDSMTS